MAMRDKQVGEALFAKLYALLTSGDSVNPQGTGVGSPASAVLFGYPGIPVSPATFKFEFSTSADQIAAASDFAYIANSRPSFRGSFSTSDMQIDNIWSQVLADLKIAKSTLSADEQKELEKLQKSLYNEGTITDPDTGEVSTVLLESPAYAKYKRAKMVYENAALQYNSLLIDFQTKPNDPLVVSNWTFNGSLFKDRLRSAYNDWVVSGKNTIEKALARIDNLTARDPESAWSLARSTMLANKRTDGQGRQFFFTSIIPRNFYDSQYETCWSPVRFDESDIHTTSTASSTSWGGGVSVSFGLWSVGGGVSHSEEKKSYNSDAKDLKVRFEMAKIPVRRGWWDPSLLLLRNWQLVSGAPGSLSDGKIPPDGPSGRLGGYITSIVVARNLEVTLDMTSVSDKSFNSQTSGSASVGWGPFSVRGNYSSSNSSSSHDVEITPSGFSNKGMQIIAVVCEVLPKTPNPDPSLTW